MENAAPDDSKDDKEGLKHSLVRVLIYSLGAGIVFLAGKLSWWLALLLFVVLAFYILVELIVGGAIFILIALILRIFFPAFTDYRVLRSEKFGELQKFVQVACHSDHPCYSALGVLSIYPRRPRILFVFQELTNLFKGRQSSGRRKT